MPNILQQLYKFNLKLSRYKEPTVEAREFHRMKHFIYWTPFEKEIEISKPEKCNETFNKFKLRINEVIKFGYEIIQSVILKTPNTLSRKVKWQTFEVSENEW